MPASSCSSCQSLSDGWETVDRTAEVTEDLFFTGAMPRMAVGRDGEELCSMDSTQHRLN